MSNERLNQRLVLARHPEGLAVPEDFRVEEVPIPGVGPGEVLVEAHYLAVDAALRLIVRDSDEFLFRVRPGRGLLGTHAARHRSQGGKQRDAGDEQPGSHGSASAGMLL